MALRCGELGFLEFPLLALEFASLPAFFISFGGAKATEPVIAFAGEVHVEAHLPSPQDVKVAMGLGLGGLLSKVGNEPEAFRRVSFGDIDGECRGFPEKGRSPELLLGHVDFWYDEEHDRNPGEFIFEDKQVFVFIANASLFAA